MTYSDNMLVYMRNRMVEDLCNGIEWYREYGGKEHITDTLSRVANTKGYHVDLACEEEFYRFGVVYRQKHVKITEDSKDGFMLRMYVMEQGNLVVDYDYELLMSVEERVQMARDEIEAERRMSLWNSGYRDF
jgi:predicted nucleic acid-binding protein